MTAGAKRGSLEEERVQTRRIAEGNHRARAVFLDRDGTLIQEVGYLSRLDDVHIYPWTAEAIRKLNQAGLLAIVVTNQGGVGKGFYTEELVEQVHEKIARELAEQGARLDAFCYCPHHPEASLPAYRVECRCRKPAPGTVEEAVKRFKIDLSSSYIVGDTGRDMQLGFNTGLRTILVRTGYGAGEYESQRHVWPRSPDWIAENLLEGVEKILAERARHVPASGQNLLAPDNL
jgi:D-glycero-D-manno-heptose 1,7-bisphosphate phosphatase